MEMRRNLLGLLLIPFLLGAAPSRQATYVAGTIISPTDVTSNEDVIFAYLQAGIDTYKSGSVDTTAIANGTIINLDISSSAAIAYSKLDLANSVTSSDLTNGTIVNADIGASAAIDFSKFATLTSGNILVGSAGGVPTSVTMSGDVAIIASGATTIQANSVALTTDTTGNYAAGDAEAGNATGLACTNCVAGTEIALGSDAQGDVMYYDGTDWVSLAAGTSGQFLKTQGASANPVWGDAGSWLFVETITLNSSSNSSATLPTTSDTFMMVFENAVGRLGLRFNADASANYNYNELGGSTLAATSGDNEIEITSANAVINGIITFQRGKDAGGKESVVCEVSSDTNADSLCLRGDYSSGAPNITAFTILDLDGATMSGQVHLFRLSKQ